MIPIRALLFGLASLAVALAAPSSAQGLNCGLLNPMACHNTQELQGLIGQAEVQSAIKAFLGDETIKVLQDRPAIQASDYAMEPLGGPPDKPVKLSSGDVMLTAFAPHNGNLRGALVLKPDGSVAAVGLLVMHVVYPNVPRTRGNKTTLTIFVAAETNPLDVDAITGWARDLAANAYVGASERRAPFVIETRKR